MEEDGLVVGDDGVDDGMVIGEDIIGANDLEEDGMMARM